jgi:hypothetical protein
MNDDLVEFFTTVNQAKQLQKEELDSLISNSFEEFFLEPLKEQAITPKKSKQKKIKKVETKPIVEDTLVETPLGLLSEPSDVKIQKDSLTPLNQKFATLDDLQKHYSLFLSRIQQQLSTLGGGGETNLAYMDMPLTYVTSPSYTITPQDYYIGVNYAGAVSITLPTPRKNGKAYVVKDELGEASKGVNRYITILPSGSDTIDGRDRAFIAYDYGSLTFVYRNGWRVV